MRPVIESYNPAWKTAFEELAQDLHAILEGIGTCILHVGSTAIPGMIAKPILDIDIVLHQQEDLEEAAMRLQTAGYLAKGDKGISGRFAFRPQTDLTPVTGKPRKRMAHHLYLCEPGTLAVKNHLLFRDALLTRPELAASYAALKQQLVSDRSMTREQYTREKTRFVLSVPEDMGMTTNELRQILSENQ